MITIVLAEDHLIVSQGLKLILGGERSVQLLGEARDGMEAVEMVGRLRPAVLLLDLGLPRLHGLEVARQVRRDYPGTRVLILSVHSDLVYIAEALHNGALGYLLKQNTPSELIKAVTEVAAGRQYLSPLLDLKGLDPGSDRPGHGDLDLYEALTNRERSVFQLAAEGRTKAEIAAKLFISPRTAETHRANIMRKLNLRSQTDLVRLAIRKGIIPA